MTGREARIGDAHKAAQLEIVLMANPAHDEYHTWIRTVDDILTFAEALEADGAAEGDSWTPDYSYEDAAEALESGEITVYSSYPIDQGIFVTPSRMEAQSYAGGRNARVYSRRVRLGQVAWIDGMQGQFADVRGGGR